MRDLKDTPSFIGGQRVTVRGASTKRTSTRGEYLVLALFFGGLAAALAAVWL